MTAVRDAWRLTLGTLTVLPVKPPGRLDERTAGTAMTLAPLAGALLALVVGVPLLLAEEYAAASPLLLSGLAIGALAVLTRAIHLDGLADTADGLGSARQGPAALAVMRRSDIGPFGVATLLVVLLVQAAALTESFAAGHGTVTLAVALVASRALLPLVCLPAFPAARTDGLGSTVAGSVTASQASVSVLLTAATVAAGLGLAVAADQLTAGTAVVLGVAGVVAGLPALLLVRRCARRFGGVTGDVYGAGVETVFTTVLVAVASFTG